MESSYNVTIKAMPELMLGGMLYRSNQTDITIPELWQVFAPRAGDIVDMKRGALAYGASRMLGNAGECDFEYIAAFEVTSFDNLPTDMVGWTIPGQSYAVVEINSLDDIRPVIDWFMNTWLPSSGRSRPNGTNLEEYPPSMPIGMKLYFSIND